MRLRLPSKRTVIYRWVSPPAFSRQTSSSSRRLASCWAASPVSGCGLNCLTTKNTPVWPCAVKKTLSTAFFCINSKRQVLEGRELSFPLAAAKKEIVDATKDAKSLEDVARVLKAAGVSFSRGEGELGSGDVPPEAFELMQKKAVDNVFFTARGQTGVFFVVKQFKPQPLTGEAAQQLAKRLLLNEVWREKAGEKPPADLTVRYEGDLSA